MQKHKNEIIAWANGAKIEFKSAHMGWAVSDKPNWQDDKEYRVFIPARTAFENGKKVLYKANTFRWARVHKGYIFDNDTEYLILEPDTEWKIKHDNGTKLEIRNPDSVKWIDAPPMIDWDNNIISEFRVKESTAYVNKVTYSTVQDIATVDLCIINPSNEVTLKLNLLTGDVRVLS